MVDVELVVGRRGIRVTGVRVVGVGSSSTVVVVAGIVEVAGGSSGGGSTMGCGAGGGSGGGMARAPSGPGPRPTRITGVPEPTCSNKVGAAYIGTRMQPWEAG